jgi:hypothetical protein
MSRFFPYHEIVGREPVPTADLGWLAGRISQLPAFEKGAAVLCGSIAWGCQSWRSDIDVAHFRTAAFPDLSKPLEQVVAEYVARTDGRFVAPRIDVITIGAESKRLTRKTVTSLSMGGRRVESKETTTREIFASTALRFADHVGSLVKLKGEPWQSFHETYLSSVDGSPAKRRDDLLSYLSSVTMTWNQQPLHPLNTGPDGGLSAPQLDLIAQCENFPTHLMRRILGELGRYPSPDRASDIRAAFSSIAEPWSEELLASFEPFFRLEERYTAIVKAVWRPRNRLTARKYDEQVRELATDLPFSRVEESVWRFVNDRRQREDEAKQALLAAARQREEEERRAELQLRRQHEEEAHRIYLQTRSQLPRWLRWLW